MCILTHDALLIPVSQSTAATLFPIENQGSATSWYSILYPWFNANILKMHVRICMQCSDVDGPISIHEKLEIIFR